MKCPECGYEDSDRIITIHLELYHNYTKVQSEEAVRNARLERKLRGE